MIKASTAKQWTTRRACTHGDLNATNVAIDASPPTNPQAYIFDAAGMKADFEFRDLATLEVTTLLFNSVGIDDDLLPVCRVLYDNDFMPAESASRPTNGALVQNIVVMVRAIRSHFVTEQQQMCYVLMVFDAVLRQLSGLGIQPSPNKVRNPLLACYVANRVCKWMRNVTPQLFPPAQSGEMDALLDIQSTNVGVT
jgi:hypothetical protein